MPLPVSLDKVVEEIDESIEGYGAYLNRRTGEIVSGDLDLIEDDHDMPGWMKKTATKLRAAALAEEWLLLPSEFRSETVTMIERFCKKCCAGATRRALLRDLRSGMSVGVLKAKLAESELYDAWEEFRRERMAELSEAWLTGMGVAFRK